MQWNPRVSGLEVRQGLSGHQSPAHDAYDLDAEFGPRKPITKIPMALKRRNTTGAMENVMAHAEYLAPKYAGPGLSYRRPPFQDVNAREPSAPSKNKRGRPALKRRQSAAVPAAKKVTERKKSVAECRGRRTIKKPVRYEEEYVNPPSSVASTRKSKRISKQNDSGLAITLESDTELSQSIRTWLDGGNRTPAAESEKRGPSARAKQDEVKLWLEGGSGTPKPVDDVSIDSMTIRGGGVTDSEDEAPVVTSTPKAVQVKPTQVVATSSKTVDLKRSKELVPINALASQMVAACGAELKSFWHSFADRDDEIFSNFAAQTHAAIAEMSENDRKIKQSEALIGKLRSAMMAQMDTIEKINVKNNDLMSSLESCFVDNVDDRLSRDAFDALLNRFIEEAQAQYNTEWRDRKRALAEKASRFINEALNN